MAVKRMRLVIGGVAEPGDVLVDTANVPALPAGQTFVDAATYTGPVRDPLAPEDRNALTIQGRYQAIRDAMVNDLAVLAGTPTNAQVVAAVRRTERAVLLLARVVMRDLGSDDV